MWASWAMDTHHPLLSLDNKIENIPLEVERQQGWGPNWGGNGDREEVRVARWLLKGWLVLEGWPPASLPSPPAPPAALALLNPLQLAGTKGWHECKSEEGKISQEDGRRGRGGSGILFQWKRAAGEIQVP